MRPGSWRAMGTHGHYGIPPVGRKIAYNHEVWLVTGVAERAWSDEVRQAWLEAGMPDPAEWTGRPYRLWLERDSGNAEAGEPVRGSLDVPCRAHISWELYPPSGRWPMCSCCREPMPCRAALQDNEISGSMRRIEKMMAVPFGACWGCAKPIGARQLCAVYPGENLDLSDGQTVVFHASRPCIGKAMAYELRWLAVDPRRERILTWPECGSRLLYHADGSNACLGDSGPVLNSTIALFMPESMRRPAMPDCQGHATHDHRGYVACVFLEGGCPRGCMREGHPGQRVLRRARRAGVRRRELQDVS